MRGGSLLRRRSAARVFRLLFVLLLLGPRAFRRFDRLLDGLLAALLEPKAEHVARVRVAVAALEELAVETVSVRTLFGS